MFVLSYTMFKYVIATIVVMLQSALLIALLLLVSWLVIRWRHVKIYWSERAVPFVSPNPLVGSLEFVISGNLSLWFRSLYKQYKEPYVGIWMFWKPALVIQSPDITRNILTKDSGIFRNRLANSGASDPLGSLNIFTANDPLWTAIRRRLSTLFTTAKLKSMQPLFDDKIKELKQRVYQEKDGCKCLRTIFADYTTDIIGAVTFGVKGEATHTGDGPMRKITRGFTEFNFYRSINWCSIFFWPELVDIFRFTVYPRSTTAFFKRVYNLVVDQRKNEIKSVTDPKTVLDSLLKLSEMDQDGNKGFSEDVIIAQAAVFMFAGVDSTATSLTFITYELAFNPDVQAKLYQELLEAKEKANGNIELKDLPDLVYLNCVMKETLRKYSAMGWLDRIANSDYRIDEKLTIKAGTPVCINVTGMHYDPDYFPEPEKFLPERFLPENENNIKPFTFLPFGDGPRVCIGQRFAYMHIQYAICSLLLEYEVQPVPGEPKPSELKLDPFALFLSPAKPLHVKFVPRNM